MNSLPKNDAEAERFLRYGRNKIQGDYLIFEYKSFRNSGFDVIESVKRALQEHLNYAENELPQEIKELQQKIKNCNDKTGEQNDQIAKTRKNQEI